MQLAALAPTHIPILQGFATGDLHMMPRPFTFALLHFASSCPSLTPAPSLSSGALPAAYICSPLPLSVSQGFASGDCDRDAQAIRIFLADGHRMGCSQSYAKNMGLYGQRVGCFSIITDSPKEAVS